MTAQGRIVWVSGPAVRADGMSDAKIDRLKPLIRKEIASKFGVKE